MSEMCPSERFKSLSHMWDKLVFNGVGVSYALTLLQLQMKLSIYGNLCQVGLELPDSCHTSRASIGIT